jgi:endonuclease/exonuclease/phosphatase family metal-dependent hydrolase
LNKVDILAVQEVVNVEEFQKFTATHYPQYEVALSKCGGMGKQHLGILFNKTRYQLESSKEEDRLSRAEGCDKGVRPGMVFGLLDRQNNRRLHVIVLHLKAGGQQRNDDERYGQLQILTKIVSELREAGNKNIIIMGDLNTTDYVLRNHNYQRFMSFIDTNQLVDLSAEVECTAYWWGGTDDGLEDASILDHIIVSRELFDDVNQRNVQSLAHCKKSSCQSAAADVLGITFKEVSDHCPMSAKLSL